MVNGNNPLRPLCCWRSISGVIASTMSLTRSMTSAATHSCRTYLCDKNIRVNDVHRACTHRPTQPTTHARSLAQVFVNDFRDAKLTTDANKENQQRLLSANLHRGLRFVVARRVNARHGKILSLSSSPAPSVGHVLEVSVPRVFLNRHILYTHTRAVRYRVNVIAKALERYVSRMNSHEYILPH